MDADQPWLIEDVGVGLGAALALSAANDVHVSYGGDGLRYSVRSGGRWTEEPVRGTDAVGQTSLALDGGGHGHVVFSSNGRLWYGSNLDGDWSIEDVDIEPYGFPSIAVCDDGVVSLAYSAQGGLIRHTTNAGKVWTIETIAEDEGGGISVGLAVDAACGIHVAYRGGVPASEYHVRYAWRDRGAWVLEDVDSESGSGASCSLTLDSEGGPHVSYDSRDGLLRYARREPSGWVVDSLGPEIAVVFPSLAVHGIDDVGIAFGHVRDDGATLSYIGRRKDDWRMEVIDDAHSGIPSLAFDSDGIPHIAYTGATVGDVRYATRGAPIMAEAECGD